MAICPFADQSRRYDRRYPGGYVAGFGYRLVLHTTETTGLPSYGSGAVAPHFTVDPRTGRIWQHYDTARPSRALEHRPGTIDTNNARAIQIEIVAYSDQAAARRAGGLFVGDFTDAHRAVVRKLVEWVITTHAISRTTVPTKPYPASYGDRNGVRLSDAAWRAERGVVEHQNVPHNDHGDAGALLVAPLLSATVVAGSPIPDLLTKGGKVLRLIQPGGDGHAIYLTDGMTIRWVRASGGHTGLEVLDYLQSFLRAYGLDDTVHDHDPTKVQVYGVLVGPDAPGSVIQWPEPVSEPPADSGLTAAEVQAAAEAGIRAVLGTLDNTTTGA